MAARKIGVLWLLVFMIGACTTATEDDTGRDTGQDAASAEDVVQRPDVSEDPEVRADADPLEDVGTDPEPHDVSDDPERVDIGPDVDPLEDVPPDDPGVDAEDVPITDIPPLDTDLDADLDVSDATDADDLDALDAAPGDDADAAPADAEDTADASEEATDAADEAELNECGGISVLAGSPGTPCGECGIWLCIEDGDGVTCLDPGLNACGGCGAVPVEVCDGLDNDCDDAVDEGLSCPRVCNLTAANPPNPQLPWPGACVVTTTTGAVTRVRHNLWDAAGFLIESAQDLDDDGRVDYRERYIRETHGVVTRLEIDTDGDGNVDEAVDYAVTVLPNGTVRQEDASSFPPVVTTFDAAGRPIAQDIDANSTTWAWHPNGRLARYTRHDATFEPATAEEDRFDTFGRPTLQSRLTDESGFLYGTTRTWTRQQAALLSDRVVTTDYFGGQVIDERRWTLDANDTPTLLTLLHDDGLDQTSETRAYHATVLDACLLIELRQDLDALATTQQVWRWTYDAGGRRLTEWFDEDGDGVADVTLEFDPQGAWTSHRTTFDAQGRPITDQRFNARGNVIAEATYRDGQLQRSVTRDFSCW